LNRPKRPLRSTLEELTAGLTDAVLAAARESLFELASSQSHARPRPARVARPPAKRGPRPRIRREPRPRSGSAAEAASDQLITDPQALLAALETAGPESASEPAEAPVREEPEILRPVAPPAEEPVFVPALRPALRGPALREGEEIVRTSGAGVVLRRRRV
jgi:hypothetical protein